MNEQEQLRRSALRWQAIAGVVALAAVPVHLLLVTAAGDLSVVLIILDVAIALALVTGAWAWIEHVTNARRRAAALAVLPRELSAPRAIDVAARDALFALVDTGVASAGAVGLAGAASGEMRLGAVAGYPPGFADAAPLLTLPSPNQRAVVSDGGLDHPWVAPIVPHLRAHDVVGTVPLLVGQGDPLGLLVLVTPPDSVLDVPLLEELATQLAGVLDHASLYEASFEREQALEGQEARRREFMSALSHEIRTPLTSIQAFAEILAANPANVAPGAAELVDSLSQGVERLRSLVDELIELGRSEEVTERAELRPLELGGLLDSAVSVMRPALIGREQVLTLDLPPSPLVAFADEDFLRHVILNLLSNANRHTPHGGSIIVRAGVATSGRVRIEVIDSGPGIEPAEREQIFEAYYSVQRSDTPGAPGAGLGLAIARRFTELQGGRIWVDPANSDGSGARFSVELDAPPAALGGAEAAPEVYASVAPQTTVPPSAS